MSKEYTWAQYEKDEAEWQKRLTKSKEAGKYGGGLPTAATKATIRGKVSVPTAKTKMRPTFSSKPSLELDKILGNLSRQRIKVSQVKNPELRAAYTKWLKSAKSKAKAKAKSTKGEPSR